MACRISALATPSGTRIGCGIINNFANRELAKRSCEAHCPALIKQSIASAQACWCEDFNNLFHHSCHCELFYWPLSAHCSENPILTFCRKMDLCELPLKICTCSATLQEPALPILSFPISGAQIERSHFRTLIDTKCQKCEVELLQKDTLIIQT